MPEEFEFAVTWTFRDPMTTVEYPRGWRGTLPADRLTAAREAEVLVVEPPADAIFDTPVMPKQSRKKPE